MRSVRLITGCGSSPIASVTSASAANGSRVGSRAGPRSASVGFRLSGWAFQNASDHSVAIDHSVSRPTASATPAKSGAPASRLALTSRIFAQKPDSGGKPASDSAGIANSTDSSGAER